MRRSGGKRARMATPSIDLPPTRKVQALRAVPATPNSLWGKIDHLVCRLDPYDGQQEQGEAHSDLCEIRKIPPECVTNPCLNENWDKNVIVIGLPPFVGPQIG